MTEGALLEVMHVGAEGFGRFWLVAILSSSHSPLPFFRVKLPSPLLKQEVLL
jgi:hypothetical protein